LKLQTQIPIKRQQHNQIDYNSKVFLLGSCFSDNIYNKLDYYKLDACSNPFGIQYHVIGIERLISRAINQSYFSEDEFVRSDEAYFSFDAHSKCTSRTAEDLCQKLNAQLDDAHNWITTATHIIITLGTAWVYRYIESDSIVSNCHKIPQKCFLKELLSTEAIAESLEGIITLVRSVNPKVNFIFTVSPIRHIKDGFIENNRSKAHLLSALHMLVDPKIGNYYFPSYEIQMDELRDYRFYNADMLHPNPLAIDIIWERFAQTWLSDKAQRTMVEVEAIQKGLNHKPFNPNSKGFDDFKRNLQAKIEDLQLQHPRIHF
jgi:lysophospholipase L1-like esterase